MSTTARTQALEAVIEAYALELKLPTLRARFRALAAEALREQQTPVAYLAALLEAEMTERAGWQIAAHMRTELVLDALEMAAGLRRPAGELVAHSDRGSQPGFKGSSQHRLVEMRVGDR